MESRGIDISRFGPLPTCSTMIVSVRPPERWPALTTLRCSSVRSLARSLPTTRYVVPGCSSGRLPAGSASTLSTVVQAQIGTAIRKTSHASSRIHSHRSRGRGRRDRQDGPELERGGGAMFGGTGRLARCSLGAPAGITRVSSPADCFGTIRVASSGVPERRFSP